MRYKELADKIIALQEADLKLRDQLLVKGLLSNGYNEAMQELHESNALELEKIIDQIGYPTIEHVGKDANEAAWLIIQHSISKPDFMRKCLKLLERAVAQNQASMKNLAYLDDRIKFMEAKQQTYGTQFDWDENGELSPIFVKDPINLNERRKSIGLNSIETQTSILRAQAIKENQKPPKDFKKREQEVMLWRKSVGWIE